MNIFKKLLKMLFVFISTFIFTLQLLPLLREMSVPIYDGIGIVLLKILIPPLILIAITFFVAYRFRTLEAALVGYAIPVIIGCSNNLAQHEVVQTEGIIFVFALLPGGILYLILKIIEFEKDNRLKATK